jgi:DNA-binding beta-propeller fold protein YncE
LIPYFGYENTDMSMGNSIFIATDKSGMKTNMTHQRSLISLVALALMLATGGASAQTLYEMDWGSGNVYKFTPAGRQDVLTSGLVHSDGLALDPAGNVYVGTQDGNRVVKVTPDGVQSTYAFVPTPMGLVFDSAGNLYVTTYMNNTIVKILPNGTVEPFASGLNVPYALAFDRAGNLFEADWGSGTIYEFKKTGRTLSSTPVVYATVPGNPTCVVFNSAGDLFVDTGDYNGGPGSIFEIKRGHRAPDTFVAAIADPYQMAFDNAGNLFVASGGDVNGNCITEYSRDRAPTLFATGLSSPWGLAFAPAPRHKPPQDWVLAQY